MKYPKSLQSRQKSTLWQGSLFIDVLAPQDLHGVYLEILTQITYICSKMQRCFDLPDPPNSWFVLYDRNKMVKEPCKPSTAKSTVRLSSTNIFCSYIMSMSSLLPPLPARCLKSNSAWYQHSNAPLIVINGPKKWRNYVEKIDLAKTTYVSVLAQMMRIFAQKINIFKRAFSAPERAFSIKPFQEGLW